jgi:hypothetical protein
MSSGPRLQLLSNNSCLLTSRYDKKYFEINQIKDKAVAAISTPLEPKNIVE